MIPRITLSNTTNKQLDEKETENSGKLIQVKI